MKIKNFAMLAGIGALLAACGGSTIVEPADLNEQRVFFAFNSSEISDEARDNLLGQALYMKNITLLIRRCFESSVSLNLDISLVSQIMKADAEEKRRIFW